MLFLVFCCLNVEFNYWGFGWIFIGILVGDEFGGCLGCDFVFDCKCKEGDWGDCGCCIGVGCGFGWKFC